MIQLPLQPGKYYRARDNSVVLIKPCDNPEGISQDTSGPTLRGHIVEERNGEWISVDWWWFQVTTGRWSTNEVGSEDEVDLITGPFDTPECVIFLEPLRPFVKPGPERRALILE